MNLTGETAVTLRAKVFEKWLELAGESPLTGQPEYLMLEILAYICALQNQVVQSGLEQNLISSAIGKSLDNLGLLWGLTRLEGESDENLRERILLAPFELSAVGTIEGFTSIVKAVDPSITDVSVISPTPPTVEVRFITSTGIPSNTLVAKVQAALENKKDKPVIVSPIAMIPTVVNFSVKITVDAYQDADISTLKQRCVDAGNKVIQGIKRSLGRDVVISQFVAVIGNVSGVYRTVVTSPTADIVVSPTQWANAPDLTLADVTIATTQPG